MPAVSAIVGVRVIVVVMPVIERVALFVADGLRPAEPQEMAV
jgi:hypothetical protein